MDLLKFYEDAARKKPGCYPAWLSRAQPYWTLAGTGKDSREALVCEDGTLEPHKRGFTIQPVLRVGGQLVTRDEACVTQSLERKCLPLPAVEWAWGRLRLRVEILAHGGGESSAYVRYAVKNEGPEPLAGQLYLIVHPMQVYPPWQGGHDGFSRIRSVKYEDGEIRLDGGRRICLATRPDGFAAKGGTYRAEGPVEGDIAEDVVRDDLPLQTEAEDAEGLASAVAVYAFELREGRVKDVYVAVPLHERAPEWTAGMAEWDVRARYEAMRAEAIAFWESKVNRVEIRVPDPAITDTLKANLAYNLVTRDGVGFQPGSRSYDKSWMRDGGSAGLALLQMGFREEAREFIEWIGSFQQESGEIPPVIDTKREDPLWEEKAGLTEYDSQGQFVDAVWQYYQYTRDRKFLESQFGRVQKALEFLAQLRAKRCTAEYLDGPPEKRVCYGILPDSRSYESAAGGPFHTYWDDFWALAGWKGGKAIAGELGRQDLVPGMQSEYEALRGAVCDSIALAMKLKHMDCLPNFAEHDAFEPAFTLGALARCDEMGIVYARWITAAVDRYIEILRARQKPGAEFVFAPYELMIVPAFLRRGEKRRALDLLQFMLGCRRPRGWNQLAEVVGSDSRFPRNLGDMPHTWVGAEYIQAVRSLFVLEEGEKLVVGAGVPEEWLDHGHVVSITHAPTRFGGINLEEQAGSGGIRVRVWGDARPPGGILLKSPLEGVDGQVYWDGQAWREVDAAGVAIDNLPAEVIIKRGMEGCAHEQGAGVSAGADRVDGNRVGERGELEPTSQ